MAHNHPDSAALLTRLRRIEGQVRGIQKMLEEDRDCMDVVTQVQAARAALLRVEGEVVRRHVETCVQAAINTGDKEAQKAAVADLVASLMRRD